MLPNCDAPSSIQIIAFLLFLVFEYWLGRTPRFKPNSTISLIASIAAAIIARLVSNRRNHGS